MARYIAKFCKGQGVKFISHLDLMRSFQRAFRRAKLPIAYSKGFNPHAEFSFATPLAVGTASVGEYIDFTLDEYMDKGEVMKNLNAALPDDIQLTDIKLIDETQPSLMSVVDASSYDITIVNVNKEWAESAVELFLKMKEIKIAKSGKNGTRIIDIKPMIRYMKLKRYNDEEMVLEVLVDSGSRSNLNPELIIDAFKVYIKGFENAEIRDITKLETYISSDLKTPMEMS